jgi:hypothetical protein
MAPRGGARKGAGRPPVFGEAPLEIHQVRTLAAEWKTYKQTAKGKALSLNTWIRETLNQSAKH